MFEEIEYPSVEHAYQAAKTLDLAERQTMSIVPTAGKVKRYGSRVTLCENWDAIKK